MYSVADIRTGQIAAKPDNWQNFQKNLKWGFLRGIPLFLRSAGGFVRSSGRKFRTNLGIVDKKVTSDFNLRSAT